MHPIGVPSLFNISKITSRIAVRVTSAIASPGEGDGRNETCRVRPTKTPFAGWPLTATMSPRIVTTPKFLDNPDAAVTLRSLAKFAESQMSCRYSTWFSTLITRIDGVTTWPTARLQYVAMSRIVIESVTAFRMMSSPLCVDRQDYYHAQLTGVAKAW